MNLLLAPDISVFMSNIGAMSRSGRCRPFDRDAAQAASDGSQDVKDTRMGVFDLGRVRDLGVKQAADKAVGDLLRDEASGFWVHLDDMSHAIDIECDIHRRHLAAHW